ncbi:adenine deaminase [Metabacillus indicus]|uniref:Adenine deaminase n=1 Tax=Metabacillus indicus TaxID=246786 RepID=A0A084H384_METID|nr:adenine deaminase [Metabacillus indicus]KEZ54046.1 adenine deaminase [Metabacillus indicus]
MTEKKELKYKIRAASKKEKAELVFKNARIVDVFNLDIIQGDVAVSAGKIVGIGDYEGHDEIDASDKFICPGLIDGHVHIESSMVPPHEFAEAVLPHGVTAVIADPHEIANVSGVNGIQYMLDSSEGIPLDVFIMLPSCVPATSFEHSGARLEAEDLQPFFLHERVIGLAEVMDYVAVSNTSDSMMDKLEMALKHSSLLDGHMAGLPSDMANVYRSAGISTDHEVTTAQEAIQRVQRGMYVQIRQGSAAKDFNRVIGAVNQKNARRFLFCTDDKHLDDLVKEGSVDHHIRLAVKHGIHPVTAIGMATLNAAECYGLKSKGAVAPGYDADLVLVDDLSSFKVDSVYKRGVLTAANGKTVKTADRRKVPGMLLDSVVLPEIDSSMLAVRADENQLMTIIEAVPNQLITRRAEECVNTEGGFFVPSADLGHVKLIMAERHKGTGLIGKGILKGFPMKRGAIATTIAHDSHNLIAAGMSDEDLIHAAAAIKEMGGGLAVAADGKILAKLPLPVSGLLSDQPYEKVLDGLQKIHDALAVTGLPDSFNPFLTLSFLGLPVIPELKITCEGIFDVAEFRHI